ncbi:MAG: thermonuclease family protein [Phycisphaerales bacterium JB063]
MGKRQPQSVHPDLRRLPVEAFLRRRRWSKSAALLVALIALVVLAVLDRQGAGLYATDDLRRYHGQTFDVVRVIDGDTLVIRAPDGEHATTTVRLWGVNTPELAKADGSRPDQPLSQEATALVRSLVADGAVTLELEAYRTRGRYGRLLAHVVLPDGSQLGARLIEAGFSESDDRWSHRLLSVYDLLELQARAQKVGRWAARGPTRDRPITPRRLAGRGHGAYTGGVSRVKLVDSEGTRHGIWPIKPLRQAARRPVTGDRGDQRVFELGAVAGPSAAADPPPSCGPWGLCRDDAGAAGA